MLSDDTNISMDTNTGAVTVNGMIGAYAKIYALIVLTTCTNSALCAIADSPSTYCSVF